MGQQGTQLCICPEIYFHDCMLCFSMFRLESAGAPQYTLSMFYSVFFYLRIIGQPSLNETFLFRNYSPPQLEITNIHQFDTAVYHYDFCAVRNLGTKKGGKKPA